jgi:hypothetical protein
MGRLRQLLSWHFNIGKQRRSQVTEWDVGGCLREISNQSLLASLNSRQLSLQIRYCEVVATDHSVALPYGGSKVTTPSGHKAALLSALSESGNSYVPEALVQRDDVFKLDSGRGSQIFSYCYPLNYCVNSRDSFISADQRKCSSARCCRSLPGCTVTTGT